MAKLDFTAASNIDAFADAASRAADRNDALRSGKRKRNGTNTDAVDTVSASYADDIVTESENNTVHGHVSSDVPSPATGKAVRRKVADSNEGKADDVNPRRGRPRGPARKTHSITMPDDVWTEMSTAAVDNETNISALLEELWIKKGRRHYAR